MAEISKAQIEMDRAMGQVERMGAKRMRDVAEAVTLLQEYSRSTPAFKTDCIDVVVMLIRWAAWLEEADKKAEKHLDVTGKPMRDPDDQMEYLGG